MLFQLGVTPPSWDLTWNKGGGTPFPGLDGRYPHPMSGQGGTPILPDGVPTQQEDWMGYPPSRPGKGYPLSKPGKGYPPSRPGKGVPPIQVRSQDGGCYPQLEQHSVHLLYPHPRSEQGGTPILPDGGTPNRKTRWGTPHPDLRKGYPSVQTWEGVPPVQTWEGGTPCTDLGRGYPLSGRIGYPPPPSWEGWGYSPVKKDGGTPLLRQLDGIPQPEKWTDTKHNLLSSFGCGL